LTFEKRLTELGYIVERLDACHLWETGDVKNCTITNFLKQIEERVRFYQDENAEEIVVIGHGMGGFTAIIAESRIRGITKIVSLCPPPDRIGSEKEWRGGQFRQSERDLPEDTGRSRSFDVPYSFAEDGLQYSAK
jgi:pimeloyl-ACP methyl ester carboxylesterase